MDPIRISMLGFAEVTSAAPKRKASALRRFRTPTSGESVGRSNYYVRALSLIRRYHRGQHSYVASELSRLLAEAGAATEPRTRVKLLNNYRAVTEYLNHFGKRRLSLTTCRHLYFVFENLIVSAQPDLVAEEDGELVLVKLNLSKTDFPGGVTSVLLHVLYQAAQEAGLQIKTSSVECVQTNSGSRTTGPRRGFPGAHVLRTQSRALLDLMKKE